MTNDVLLDTFSAIALVGFASTLADKSETVIADNLLLQLNSIGWPQGARFGPNCKRLVILITHKPSFASLLKRLKAYKGVVKTDDRRPNLSDVRSSFKSQNNSYIPLTTFSIVYHPKCLK